jgi:hypothetical protein
MEKSRTSRRLKQAGFFTVVLIIGNVLLGCGQHSTVTGVLGVGGVLGQQSFDDQGADDQIDQRPYLALSSPDEQNALSKLAPENAANKQFASQVIAATVTRSGIGAEVQMRTTTSNAPLIFKGDLTATDYLAYVGNFPESSGQRSDLTLYVSCSDQSCSHADLFLSDNQGHKAAIVVSSEDRILTTTIPDGETEDQVKGLLNIPQKTKVHYNLTETSPGISTYTVSTIEAHPRIIAEGPIQNTENGSVAAQSAILDKTETMALEGVDANNLVLNVASIPDPKKPDETKNVIVKIQAADGVTVRPKPVTQKNPTVTATAPENCKVHLTGEVNSMVNDILKECNQSKVAEGVSWWKTQPHLPTYNNFMRYYEESKTATTRGKGLDFKTMVDLLHSQNFPTVWSWVTARESAFNYHAVGGAKELGVWQIAPKTRVGLKMDDDGATEISIATKGAMTLYQSLIKKYPHNIPMILAGYNAGEGGAKYMQDLIDAHISDDFWQLCGMSVRGLSKTDKKKVPSRGTCEYVGEIIAGMITSLDPKDYGMTNIGAMEAK